ncbi:hypothetical protein [Halobacteriovorax sp. HLS]|uniref:hypothetical protein n=1 Tax=Halobacteriovorax sp. HLS TaxID=2234000 RepID=UPI000FD79224|nr:hypothetical protein [Halobacteriovorax sp. HLS]
MTQNFISIKGARTHNLKNVDLAIALNSITCIAGPSGSGKSSLAFHTLLSESKRRFMNSFPGDVKFFWDIPQSADVDEIFPVLPVWGLAQTNPVVGSRPSAVDLVGVNDQLSKLIFSLGDSYCKTHKQKFVEKIALNQIRNFLEAHDLENEAVHFFMESTSFKKIYGDSFLPARSFCDEVRAFNYEDEYWELFRIKGTRLSSLDKKFKELNLENINGSLKVFIPLRGVTSSFVISKERSCPVCDESIGIKIDSPQNFSAFTPLGACSVCSGHGMNLEIDREKIVKNTSLSLKEGAVNFLSYSRFEHIFPVMLKEAKKSGFDITIPFCELPSKVWNFLEKGSGQYVGLESLYEYLESKRYKKNVRILLRSLKTEVLCQSCNGTRLKNELLSFCINTKQRTSVQDILEYTFSELLNFLVRLEKEGAELLNWKNSQKIVKQLIEILKVSVDLGLGHLKLLKKVKYLSVNDYQKLLLVKYLSFQGSGSLFVLDEASLGIDLDEQKVLLKYLKKLKKNLNTILLVDHSEYLQKNSDEVIVMGPGAGHLGGEIVYQGKFRNSKIEMPTPSGDKLKELKLPKVMLNGESRDLSLSIEGINVIRGKSYSLKKDYYIEAVANIVSEVLGLEKISSQQVQFSRPKGLVNFNKVLVLNSKFNRYSSRSTVGTMIGLTPFIRKYYASLAVSKNLGLKDGHFSPNSDLGKCLSCEGKGVHNIDMQFLEDVVLSCDDCNGMKLKPFIATISDGNFTINEVFTKPLSEVLPSVKLTPKGRRIWDYLKLLNLDYLNLDRPLSSLSGGEKQRLKLLSELQSSIENSLVIFEDLSFGLSSTETLKICEFLESLKNKGNTIILVDENVVFSNFADRNIEFQ